MNTILTTRLMALEEWRVSQFTTPPAKATVRRWAIDGSIPAIQIGASWFVQIDLLPTINDPLVEHVLRN